MAARWIDTKATCYVRAVNNLGMTITTAAAARLIQHHVTLVASQLGITEQSARRYVDDETLTAMAESEVAKYAAEAPGATITLLDADCAVPAATVGELIFAILSTVDLETGAPEERVTPSSLIQAAGELAFFQSRLNSASTACVRVPRALLNRTGRYLEAVASLIDVYGLGDTACEAAVARSVQYFAALSTNALQIASGAPTAAAQPGPIGSAKDDTECASATQPRST